jgi:outer membrane protein TolC
VEEFNKSEKLGMHRTDNKEIYMLGSDRKDQLRPVSALKSAAILATVFFSLKIAAAQTLPPATPPVQPRVPTLRLPVLVSKPIIDGADSAGGQPTPSGQPRRITLEQVKQQSANRVASPLAYMGQLSVEAARQHRLGVQADYFPKFGATFVNLHATDFLGQIFRVPRPIMGTVTPVPVDFINKNLTIAALTFVQPITPVLEVRQAVRIARADERIAMAKAAASVSKAVRDTEIEAAYFKLLIAQRELTSAEWKMRSGESRPLYAAASADVIRISASEPRAMEARKAVATAAATVRELTASLNRIMGWPENTELELAMPDPLVENVSLQEVTDKSTAPNPALVEAEQTVVKARAAANLSKLAYVPTVAAVSGYLFQNILPAVNSNFGYGGVMASYTLFDFGKRQHAIKESRAQLEMAETALQLTKAKLASDVKKSYFELERSRQLSQVAQKIGSSTALLMKVSSNAEGLEVRAARADVELEMLEADFAHRQAYNRLRALMSPER